MELTNAKSWLTGKRASLQISVNEENGEPAAGAEVEAQIEGSVEPLVYAAEAGESGQAQIEFEMPKIGGGRSGARDSRGEARWRGALAVCVARETESAYSVSCEQAMTNGIVVQVNGESRETAAGTTVRSCWISWD